MSSGDGQSSTEDNMNLEDDDDIEALKKKAEKLEKELKNLESSNPSSKNVASQPEPVAEDVEEFVAAKDDHSIYIGNLADEITPEELQNFFSSCGIINRITIMCNKHTGKSKGYAFMEFEEIESVDMACGLNETELKGRPIVVTKKRKNLPKFILSRGRGGRGGPRGGRGRGTTRGFRGSGGNRGRGRFAPY